MYGLYDQCMANSSWSVTHLLWIAAIVLFTAPTAVMVTSTPPPAARAITFLTRDGCVNTTTLLARLDEALERLGIATAYVVVDADTLADGDARRGYGTPTILYDNRDVFGMPEPTPPMPSPT